MGPQLSLFMQSAKRAHSDALNIVGLRNLSAFKIIVIPLMTAIFLYVFAKSGIIDDAVPKENLADVIALALSVVLAFIAVWPIRFLLAPALILSESEKDLGELKQAVRPEFALNVVQDSQLILPADAGPTVPHHPAERHKQLYLCGKVEAPPHANIERCTAYITSLYIWDRTIGSYTEINIGHALMCRWSNRGGDREIDIPAMLFARYNIARFDQKSNDAQLEVWGLPFRLETAIAAPGKYLAVIVVNGSGRSCQSAIEFKWGPEWDKVSAHVATPQELETLLAPTQSTS